jgi:hypothetical protein
VNGGREDLDGFVSERNWFIVCGEVLKVEFDGLSGVCRRLLDGAAVRKAPRKQRDYYPT